MPTNPIASQVPVDLRGAYSQLSSGEKSILAKQPFTDHFKNVTKVGAKQPRVLSNGAGLYYWGNSSCGDFTGTTQFVDDDETIPGSGGPAGLPYSTCGYNTLHSAGKVLGISASTSQFQTEINLDTRETDWTYKVKMRHLTAQVIGQAGAGDHNPITGCSWTAATRVVGKTGAFAAFEFTGDDWCRILRAGPSDGVTGWYRIERATDDALVLDPSASIVHATDLGSSIRCMVYQSAQAIWCDEATWDETTNTFTATMLGNFTGYVPGPDDVIEIRGGENAVRTFSKITGATADTITVADDDLAPNGTADCQFVVYKRTDFEERTITTWSPENGAISITAGSWNAGTKRLTQTGKFTNYIWTKGDTYGASGGTDWVVKHYLIKARIDANTIELETDSDQPPGNTTDSVGSVGATSVVTVSSAFSFTPQPGDFYYIWIDSFGVDTTSVRFIESNPEACGTETVTRQQVSMWPYGTYTKCTKQSGKSILGVGNVHSSEPGSDMNMYWFGVFDTAPEAFLTGDELVLRSVMDIQLEGCPAIIEVLLLPNFDPVRDWDLTTVPNTDRLLATSRHLWFQSPTIYKPGELPSAIYPMQITLRIMAGAVQTIPGNEAGDNYSQQATCEFALGPPSSIGSETGPTLFPATRGPLSRITLINDYDWTSRHTRWTVLVKAEHPSMSGKPGYHGYYAGEPFSCTTGNGGVLLHPVGRVPDFDTADTLTHRLPWAPRIRVAKWSAVWTPGGNY